MAWSNPVNRWLVSGEVKREEKIPEPWFEPWAAGTSVGTWSWASCAWSWCRSRSPSQTAEGHSSGPKAEGPNEGKRSGRCQNPVKKCPNTFDKTHCKSNLIPSTSYKRPDYSIPEDIVRAARWIISISYTERRDAFWPLLVVVMRVECTIRLHQM